jgi:hypothetical protein
MTPSDIWYSPEADGPDNDTLNPVDEQDRGNVPVARNCDEHSDTICTQERDERGC